MDSSFFSQQMAPWCPNFPHQRLCSSQHWIAGYRNNMKLATFSLGDLKKNFTKDHFPNAVADKQFYIYALAQYPMMAFPPIYFWLTQSDLTLLKCYGTKTWDSCKEEAKPLKPSLEKRPGFAESRLYDWARVLTQWSTFKNCIHKLSRFNHKKRNLRTVLNNKVQQKCFSWGFYDFWACLTKKVLPVFSNFCPFLYDISM